MYSLGGGEGVGFPSHQNLAKNSALVAGRRRIHNKYNNAHHTTKKQIPPLPIELHSMTTVTG